MDDTISGTSTGREEFVDEESEVNGYSYIEEKGGTKPENDSPKSGIFGTSLNFMNTQLGAGILGIPLAMSQSGAGLGLIFLIVCGFLVDYACRMIVRVAKKVEVYKLEELCEHALGRFGFYGVSIACGLFNFGAICSYSVMIMQTIPLVVGEWIYGPDATCAQTTVVVIVGTVVVHLMLSPLCLMKDLSSLAFTSGVSVVTFFGIVVIAFFKAPEACAAFGPDELCPKPITFFSELDTSWFESFDTIGVYLFGIVCMDSVFQLYNSLHNATPTRWRWTTHISIGTVCTLYAGFSTYLTAWFGSRSKGNILCTFPKDDALINAARLTLGLCLALTYPMSNFLMRDYVFSILRPQFPNIAGSRAVLYGLTYGTLATTTLLALTVGDLGVFMAVTGNVAGAAIGFILPVLVYFKIEGFQNLRLVAKKRLSNPEHGVLSCLAGYLEIILPGILLILGFIALFVGTPAVIMLHIQGSGDVFQGADGLKTVPECRWNACN
eukprot:909465_1